MEGEEKTYKEDALFHERVKRVVNVKLWLYDAMWWYVMWWYAIGRALVPAALSWYRGKLVVQQTAYFGRQSTKDRDVSEGVYIVLAS